MHSQVQLPVNCKSLHRHQLQCCEDIPDITKRDTASPNNFQSIEYTYQRHHSSSGSSGRSSRAAHVVFHNRKSLAPHKPPSGYVTIHKSGWPSHIANKRAAPATPRSILIPMSACKRTSYVNVTLLLISSPRTSDRFWHRVPYRDSILSGLCYRSALVDLI
jgi:hypothetical protein